MGGLHERCLEHHLSLGAANSLSKFYRGDEFCMS